MLTDSRCLGIDVEYPKKYSVEALAAFRKARDDSREDLANPRARVTTDPARMASHDTEYARDDSEIEAQAFWDSEAGRSILGDNDNPPEAERDRPLTFHWKVDREAVARTGYQLIGVDDDDRCMRSMMADLVLAGRAGECVSYSRNSNYYRDPGRYCGISYAYGRIKICVEILLQLGLIEDERAKPGDHLRTQRQSRMRATEKLLDAFADVAFEFDPLEIIRLRDVNGRLVGYDENASTIAMRRELTPLNNFVRGVTVALPDADVIRRGDLLLVDGATVRVGPIFMYRSFCRGKFSCGGRIYGFWQNLPKARRKNLLLDGKEVFEYDYKSMHIHMLHARRGVRLEHDPYDILGVERAHAKLALLVIINARTRRQAICALVHARLKNGSRWPYDHAATADLIDRIIARNPVIAADVCSDKGVRLMRDDSEIAIRVMKACMKKGIVCLPVHDSFIVQEDHKDELAAIATAEMKRYEDRFTTKKKQVVSYGNSLGNVVHSLTEGDRALPVSSAPPVRDLAPVTPPAAPPALRAFHVDDLPVRDRRWDPRPSVDRSVHVEVDARGYPVWDLAESRRRQEAHEVARLTDPSAEYFPVVGESEWMTSLIYGRSWKAASDEAYRDQYAGYHLGEISIPPQTSAERAANRRLPIEEGGSGWGLKRYEKAA